MAYRDHSDAVWLSAILAATAAACARCPINECIAHVDAANGYRANSRIAKHPGDDSSTLFLLAFSGGGTRRCSAVLRSSRGVAAYRHRGQGQAPQAGLVEIQPVAVLDRFGAPTHACMCADHQPGLDGRELPAPPWI
jgi:hypothetical protein